MNSAKKSDESFGGYSYDYTEFDNIKNEKEKKEKEKENEVIEEEKNKKERKEKKIIDNEIKLIEQQMFLDSIDPVSKR